MLFELMSLSCFILLHRNTAEYIILCHACLCHAHPQAHSRLLFPMKSLEKLLVDIRFDHSKTRNIGPLNDLSAKELNLRWIKDLQKRYGDHSPIIGALSIFEEGDVKKIRMGNLACMGANKARVGMRRDVSKSHHAFSSFLCVGERCGSHPHRDYQEGGVAESGLWTPDDHPRSSFQVYIDLNLLGALLPMLGI